MCSSCSLKVSGGAAGAPPCLLSLYTHARTPLLTHTMLERCPSGVHADKAHTVAAAALGLLVEDDAVRASPGVWDGYLAVSVATYE